MFFKKDPEKERLKQERKQQEKERRESLKREREQKAKELKEKRDADIRENVQRVSTFKSTSFFEGVTVDEVTEMFKLTDQWLKVFRFDEVVDYEVIQDGHVETQGALSLKRAAVGGVLLAGVGAFAGGLSGKRKSETIVSELKFVLKMTGIHEGVYTINLLKKPVPKGSKKYTKVIGKLNELSLLFDKHMQIHRLNTIEGE